MPGPRERTPGAGARPGETAFWRRLELEEMSPAQWESLCDGCGRCCLAKLEDEDTGEIAFTWVACRLLDVDRCRCTDYPRRTERVPGCVRITPERARGDDALPETCAYRLLARGLELPDWHPLVSGDPESVHRAGISVRGRAVGEDHVPSDELEDWIADGI